MADTQWNIEYLLATAVAYMRDVGMPNEADAIIELQRRAATQPADAALDDARAQKPVAYMHNKRADVIHTSVKSLLSDFAVNSGPESMLRPIDKSEHYTIPLYAAPVPAQPAVPDFIPALYSWLARAHFDNQQDEVTASRFGQQLHAWITAQPSAVSEAVAKASKLLRAHNEWRRGADNTDAYTATGLGNAIDTVCDHIEEVLGMVSTQIIPADVMNDAARYQWLKQRSPFGNRAPHIEQYPFQSGFDKVKLPHFTVVGLDDAIDAAIDAALLSAADTEVKNGNA